MNGDVKLSLPTLTPSDGGDLIVAAILGHVSIGEVAAKLGVPRGKVLGWCERVKAELTDARVEPPTWRPHIGKMEVTHTANRPWPLVPGAEVTFTLTITNRTRADLFGITVIQRSFTNPSLCELHHCTPMRPTTNPDVPLEPGHQIQYESTYRLEEDDLTQAGLIINAVAVKAFTAAGACILDEQDADLLVP